MEHEVYCPECINVNSYRVFCEFVSELTQRLDTCALFWEV